MTRIGRRAIVAAIAVSLAAPVAHALESAEIVGTWISELGYRRLVLRPDGTIFDSIWGEGRYAIVAGARNLQTTFRDGAIVCNLSVSTEGGGGKNIYVSAAALPTGQFYNCAAGGFRRAE